ncbi:MFS transporter [Gordonia insulae]|uniref:Purine efflux pump PbuE n=1 Tax=Gordonia insulae TaxID=2420509 RepID=A0A3G8JQW6_9ACTN|nr:MFS transporter [Gordonia insulae]AZG46560.1 Purine efflux pump PbuE [Gordonia insulae]
MTTDVTAPERGVRENLPALLSLGIAACLAVTTEMLPVGLLPAIGDAFGVADSTMGLLVTVFATMVAVFAVPLTIATTRLRRKPLILATVGAYLVSNLLIATAPTFAFVAGGRVLGGIAHALFFSVCIGYVPRLVERGQVGRGLAVVAGGSTAGFVLGVPLSTTLGAAVGWRNAFGLLAVLAVVTGVLIVRFLPAVGGAPAGRRIETPGARRGLSIVVTSNMLTFIGQYTVYTYISVVLLTAGADESWIGPLLLLCGLCGLLGLACAGRTIDPRPAATVLTVLGLLAAAIVGVGLSHQWLVVLVIVVALWNGVFGGVPSIFQSVAVRAFPDAPEIAGAWINATSNVGIAVGAVLGGAVISSSSATSYLACIGAGFVVLGLAVALIGRRAFGG